MGDHNPDGRHNMDNMNDRDDMNDAAGTGNTNDQQLTTADERLLQTVEYVLTGKKSVPAKAEPVSAGAVDPAEGSTEASDSGDSSMYVMCAQLAATAAEPSAVFTNALLARLRSQLQTQAQPETPASHLLVPQSGDKGPVAAGGTPSDNTLGRVVASPAHSARNRNGIFPSRSLSGRLTRALLAIAGAAAMLLLLVGMWATLKLRKDISTQAQQGGQTATALSILGSGGSATPAIPSGSTSPLPHASPVNALDLAPKLQLVLTRTVGNISSGPDGQPLMAWSPDGRLASTGHNVVAVFDPVSGQPGYIAPFSNGEGARALQWSPDGRIIAVGLSYDEVVLLDGATGRELYRLSGSQMQAASGTSVAPPNGYIASIAWSPDGRMLAAAPSFDGGSTTGRTGEVRIWDAAAGTLVRTLSLADLGNYTPPGALPSQPQATTRVAWSPDGRAIASISDRRVLAVWDASTGARLNLLQEGSFRWEGFYPRDFAWAPDGRSIAAITQYSVEVWDPYAGKVLHSLPDPPPTWPAFIPPPIATSTPAIVPPTSTPTYVYASEQFDTVKGAAWSPDGSRLVSFDGGHLTLGTARVWDASTGKRVYSKSVDSHSVNRMSVSWSPDGRVLAYGGSTIDWWDAQTGVQLRELDISYPWGFVWSADGSLFAGYSAGRIYVWGDPALVPVPTSTPILPTPPALSTPNSTVTGPAPMGGCGAWEIVQSPNVDTVNEFLAVHARSDDDVWAVGYHNIGTETYVDGTRVPADQVVDRTLIVHFDGTRWRPVDSPNPGSGNNRLTGVVALSAGDAWAVGYYEEGEPEQVRQRALILRWNGTQWQEMASPIALAESSRLTAIAALSPDDAWAVGYSGGDYVADSGYAAPTSAIILHWDGKVWSQVNTPEAGKYRNELYGLSALNENAVWAIGRFTLNPLDSSVPRTGAGPDAQPLLLFWNGKEWGQVAAPPEGNAFTGIAAASADRAWAVGSIGSEGSNYSVVLQWDGRIWSIADATVPNPTIKGAPHLDNLQGVVALSPNDVWAVGWYNPQTSPSRIETLVMHWDGTKWRRMASPNLEREAREINGQMSKHDNNMLHALTAAPSGDLWAVGSYHSSWPGLETLILRYRRATSGCTSPSPAPSGPTSSSAESTKQPGTSTLTPYP